jgi:diguanylate cyclase (GGDEF)-like protein
MSQKKPSTGMLVDGVFASEAIDSSGEIVSISGMDISTMEDGGGIINYEHKGEDDGGFGKETVGKVVFVRKIFKESDCEDDRQHDYYKKLKGIPFLYGVARLFDGAGHEGARALAAAIRDHVANNEPILLRWSIEGTTTKKDGNKIASSIAKRCALTWKPCNKTCDSGLVSDPNAPDGFSIQKAEAQFVDPEFAPLGAGFEMECNPCMDKKTEASLSLLSTAMKLKVLVKARRMEKATSAGNYDVAPSNLTGGAALQRESVSTIRNTAKAALRDYGWEKPFRRSEFRSFAKAKLPEVSEEFLDHFADIAEAYSVKKTTGLAKKEPGEKPAKTSAKPPRPRPIKNSAPDYQPGGHAVIEDIPDEAEAPEAEKGIGNRKIDSGTVRGKRIKPGVARSRPVFDAKKGILHTPAGSFKAYLPKHDGPESEAHYKTLLSHPDIESAMDVAMTNWTKVHKLFKAGKLPPEVVMHAVMFATLSPNKPVPTQEIQYCLDQDTILVTCAGQKKAIRDFMPGDELWGVDAQGDTIKTSVVRLFDQGVLAGWEAEFEDGYKVVCSSNHKFLTEKGMVPLERIVQDRLGVYCERSTARGMASPLRRGIQDPTRESRSSQGLFEMQGGLGAGTEGTRQKVVGNSSGRSQGDTSKGRGEDKGIKSKESSQGYGWDSEMGEGVSRGVRRQTAKGGGGYEHLAEEQPGGVHESYPQRPPSYRSEMASAKPRSLYEKCLSFGGICGQMETREPEAFFKNDRKICTGRTEGQQRIIDRTIGSPAYGMGTCSDTLRREDQGSGFGQSGPQDMDRSRRVLSFLFKEIQKIVRPSDLFTRQRQNAEGRGVEEGRRDATEGGGGLLLKSSQDAEGGLVGMGSGHDSFSTARCLVLRSVIRVRPVGLRQMYDIEVSHSKHNFLLPNGVVTSNSRLVDAMDATGIDPRDPGFERIAEPYANLDHPTRLPHVAREEFAKNPAYYTGGKIGVERDQHGNKLGNPSDTGRYPGELLSGRPLFEYFLERASKYHTTHDHMVDLIGRHRGNGFDAVSELMQQKKAGNNWNKSRASTIKRGNPDPGPFKGLAIPGIKIKTGLYTLGMLGSGDSIVPDTHEVRNLYGLDLQKDGDTVDYLKQLHWRPTNVENVMRPLNQWYLKNHPAVEYTLNHPKWGSTFERPQDALFPAFWRHWLTIQPHEEFLGLPNMSQQAHTTHAPFWDSIRPHVDKAIGNLGKNEGPDSSVALRTAMVHQQYVKDYGEIPASLLYYHHLVPKLLEAAEHRRRLGSDMRFLAKSREIEAGLIDLRKTIQDTLDGTELPEFHKISIHVNGKAHPAGRFMTYDGKLEHLEDYHGILASMLPEGDITAKTISRIHGLKWSPQISASLVPMATDVSASGESHTSTAQDSQVKNVSVADDPMPPPPPVFEYHRAGMLHPHVVEFGPNGAALDGKALNDTELAVMLNNASTGVATIRYRTRDFPASELAKAERLEPDAILARIRAAEAAGHLPPGTSEDATHHMLEDSLTGANIGNKKAYQLFRGKNKPGVYLSMDANSFKHVNDTFGHTVGDEAIIGIGKALREASDKVGTGKLFRPGGDEFVAHFPSYEEASKFMRHATTGLDGIPPVQGVHKLSMSFGAGTDFDMADKALYHAKSQKKDPVTGMSAFHPSRTPHLAHSLVPGTEGAINLGAQEVQPPHLPKS